MRVLSAWNETILGRHQTHDSVDGRGGYHYCKSSESGTRWVGLLFIPDLAACQVPCSV